MATKVANKMKILNLYKTLLRESEKFGAYNYRMYAIRKIKDSFKENKSLNDSIQVDNQIEMAYKNLEVIRRQTLIGNLYSAEKLVIE